MNAENRFLLQSPVYLDCRHFDGSGIGTYIGNLLRYYDKIAAGYPIEILAREEHIAGIKSFAHFNIRAYNDPIYSIREQFRWLSKIEPFGLLHVPHYNAPLVYPGQLITTVHDVCHVAMRQFFPGFLKRVYSRDFLRLVLHKANFVITVSQFSKSEIINFYQTPAEKITVIYPGYDRLTYHSKIPKTKQLQVRKKYGITGKYFLYVGTLQPRKNLGKLIEAFAKLKNKQVKLVIGGKKGWLYDQIFEQTRDLLLENRVLFLGFVANEDLPGLIKGSQAYVLPTLYEGFGMPPVEAQAVGTPVVISRVSSLPEVIGESGIYIEDPNFVSSIQEALEKVLSLKKSEREAIIESGKENTKRFDWNLSAAKILEILHQVTGK